MDTKGTSSTMIDIDGQKLKKIIYQKLGKTNSGLSREFGGGTTFFSNMIARNKMSKRTANALEIMYGIKPEQYMKEKKEELPEHAGLLEVKEAETLTYEDIKRAMVEAINEALPKAIIEAWRAM